MLTVLKRYMYCCCISLVCFFCLFFFLFVFFFFALFSQHCLPPLAYTWAQWAQWSQRKWNIICTVIRISIENFLCFRTRLSNYASSNWRQRPNEPKRQKTYLWICAPSEDSDQPVHSRSLIRIFTGRDLDSRRCKVSLRKHAYSNI